SIGNGARRPEIGSWRRQEIIDSRKQHQHEVIDQPNRAENGTPVARKEKQNSQRKQQIEPATGNHYLGTGTRPSNLLITWLVVVPSSSDSGVRIKRCRNTGCASNLILSGVTKSLPSVAACS